MKGFFGRQEDCLGRRHVRGYEIFKCGGTPDLAPHTDPLLCRGGRRPAQPAISMWAAGPRIITAAAGTFHPYGEHRLNTIKRSPDAQNENWLNSIARKKPTKTLCTLLSIDSRLPKLDVTRVRVPSPAPYFQRVTADHRRANRGTPQRLRSALIKSASHEAPASNK
jgi:hypothetical protein